MKQLMKALCAAGLLAATMNLPAKAEDKMSGGKMMGDKMAGGKMAADKMSGAKMTNGKTMDHKMAGGKMMGGKMDGKISCPACKMMGGKMSGDDAKEMDHMKSMMSPADKKTMNGMSAAEKALVMKAAKAGLLHGKMMGKM